MLEYFSRHTRLIIVLHEIYGINEHMESICRYYSRQGYDVFCPDLFDPEIRFDLDQEKAAYEYFMKQVGFAAPAALVGKLIQRMRPGYQAIYLLGFSIGATVAWICIESNHCDGVIGYYGSRIRDYLDIKPKIPVLLIYPQGEKFAPDELKRKLQLKDKVEFYILSGKHGFSNPFSRDYCEISHKLAIEKTAVFLQKLGCP